MVDSARCRSAQSTFAKLVYPRYVSGRTTTDAWAHFPSGRVFEVSRGRARLYPGLPGGTPVTTAYYGAMHLVAPQGDCVLDVGCGAGTGTGRLLADFDKVVGVDSAADALAFAEEHCPQAEFMLSDCSTPLPAVGASGMIFADVLGHAKDPVTLIENAATALAKGGRILVAEPLAYPSQLLMAPSRRAFSKPSLQALLCRAGFEVSTWVADDSSFASCVAVAFEDDAIALLSRARKLAKREGPLAAIRELETPVETSRSDARRELALFEADLRLQVGDGDGGVRALLLAGEIDPNDARAAARLAEIALVTDSLSDAMHLALRAVDIDPTEPSAALALALAAEKLGHEDALGAWRIAARLTPDDLGVVVGLAQCAADRGDCALGIHVFEKLRQYGDPLGPDFYVTLALLLDAEGRRADALLEATCARNLAPEDPTVADLCKDLESA